MNQRRIFLGVMVMLVGAWAQAAPDLSKSITGTVTDGSNSMPYRLFRPAGHDTAGATFPLVLFLHGAGERGNNNTSQVNSHIDGLVNATQSATYASYLLAPQVPSGQQFVNVPFNTGSYTNATAPAASTSMNLTIQLVEELIQTLNVDRGRVYVTGLSMGGYGTWDIIARRPSLFAAAVPMSGGGNTDTGGLIDQIPLWAFHGSADGTVPVAGSRNMIAAMEAAGGTPEYTELAGQGHVIWSPIYSDVTTSGQLYPWMYSQAIPEPGTIGLAGLAIALLARGRRY